MRLLPLLLIPASFACFADPYELKGDALGMSLEAFRTKYHREIKGNPNNPAPMCSDTSPEGLYVKLPVRDIGLIRCLQHYPFEEKVDSYTSNRTPPTTVANVPARIVYTFIAPDVNAKSDSAYRLFSIDVSFDATSYPKVRDALIEKYGQPTKRETETFHNRMNASFEGEVVTWSRDGASLMSINQYSRSLDASSLSIIDVKDTALALERQKSKQASQGAKDL